MAYVKKADQVEASEEKVTTLEKVEVKAETPNSSAEIQDLKEQIKFLQNMIAMMSNNNMGAPAAANKNSSLLDEIKIVHLVDRAPGLSTHMQLTNTSIDLHAFGEMRTLTRMQAEELVGKYRKFFERGIIAFGPDNGEFAAASALKTVKDYDFSTNDFLGRLVTMTSIELEELYKKLGDAHRGFIIEYFKRKIIEGDTRFNDAQKIEMLNRVSGGAMAGLILDNNTAASRGNN